MHRGLDAPTLEVSGTTIAFWRFPSVLSQFRVRQSSLNPAQYFISPRLVLRAQDLDGMDPEFVEWHGYSNWRINLVEGPS